MLKKVVFVLILMSIITITNFAEEPGAKPHVGEGDVHTSHSHHAGIFVGITSNLETEHNDFSIGIDYEYRLPILKRIFGIGIMGEAVFGLETEYIAGIPLYIHLADFLRVFVAPSILYVPDSGEEPESKIAHDKIQSTEASSHSEYVTIAGLFLDIQTRNFTISPTLKFEFIGGHIAMAYGLTFAKAF